MSIQVRLNMPEKLWDKVIMYQTQNKLTTRADAVESLIKKGLKVK